MKTNDGNLKMLPFCLDSDIMEILSLPSLFAPKISSVLEAFALILSLCPLHEFSLACANEYDMFRLILPGIVMI